MERMVRASNLPVKHPTSSETGNGTKHLRYAVAYSMNLVTKLTTSMQGTPLDRLKIRKRWKEMPNRVRTALAGRPPTPPDMPVRIRRFTDRSDGSDALRLKRLNLAAKPHRAAQHGRLDRLVPVAGRSASVISHQFQRLPRISALKTWRFTAG